MHNSNKANIFSSFIVHLEIELELPELYINHTLNLKLYIENDKQDLKFSIKT